MGVVSNDIYARKESAKLLRVKCLDFLKSETTINAFLEKAKKDSTESKFVKVGNNGFAYKGKGVTFLLDTMSAENFNTYAFCLSYAMCSPQGFFSNVDTEWYCNEPWLGKCPEEDNDNLYAVDIEEELSLDELIDFTEAVMEAIDIDIQD